MKYGAEQRGFIVGGCMYGSNGIRSVVTNLEVYFLGIQFLRSQQ